MAVLASGSLSHRFIDDQRAEEGMNSYTREFDHQMDERVVKLWREGKFKEFCTMLPEYADYCYGEGNMHDTVMLLGLLGWDCLLYTSRCVYIVLIRSQNIHFQLLNLSAKHKR